MRTTSFMLPARMMEQIQRIAARNGGLSMGAVIRLLITKQLEREDLSLQK